MLTLYAQKEKIQVRRLFCLPLYIRIVACVLLFHLSLSSTIIWALAPSDHDPVQLVQDITNQMLSQLRAQHATLKKNPQIVYRLANRYIIPYVDLTEMSRQVLSPAIWNQATPEERTIFKNQFTRLLIRTYASALASYQNQTVTIYPVRGGYKTSVVVKSEVSQNQNSSSISIYYKLFRNNSHQWRLYDLSVGDTGTSLIESFRGQFEDLVSQGYKISQLSTFLAKHTRSLES